MRSRIVLTALVAGLLALGTAPVAVAAPPRTTVAVTGEVTGPATYTPAALAALPQVSLPTRQPGAGGTVTGVPAQELVVRAGPRVTPQRNAQLRVLLTVRGQGGRSVTLALGELDPGFGNRPALLVTRGERVDLVVPGDRFGIRTVRGVTSIDVAVPAAGPAAVPPGAVRVLTPRGERLVTAATLARLPARTRTVTFLAGGVPETHTETGPPLALVLAVAGVAPLPDTAVVAVGTDAYGAAVTMGEEYVGDRPLLLSLVEDGAPLAQPRLVPDGDVRGGRYVSGVVVLDVRSWGTEGPTEEARGG